LKKEKSELVGQYFQDSERLSEIREKIAENLQNTVDVQLDDLNMENAKFKVEITKTQEITIYGIDNAEFMIAANVGETFKPLAKIASGGEISRIMLALKTVFSAVDNISVLIFDEIDTGISGETVRRVAEKLRELSKNTQIICVTHSPQIAGRHTAVFHQFSTYIFNIAKNILLFNFIIIFLRKQEKLYQITIISISRASRTSLFIF